MESTYVVVLSDFTILYIPVTLSCDIQFLSANFTVILFHYDGNVDGWEDLQWSKDAIHIVAHNQTKW